MPVESNHNALAGRITTFAAKRRKRVTEKRVGPDRANKEIEGCMADAAMLTRATPMAIGSSAPPGSAPTCTPVLVTG